MNDFTKEELEIIYLDMTVYAKKATPLNESPSHLDLRNKIQSLINDYCEHECIHESDGYDYFRIAEDELLLDVLKARKNQFKCKKCQRIYDENQ